MSNRINQTDLENLLERINIAAGRNIKPYSNDGTRFHPNAGTYLLDWAYGGVRLSQMSMKEGCTGQRGITSRGTKRETYERMQAFLAGMKEQQ